MLAFVFVAWEVSFGLWLQTQLCSKADFEGYRETSPPQLTSLPRAGVQLLQKGWGGSPVPRLSTRFSPFLTQVLPWHEKRH